MTMAREICNKSIRIHNCLDALVMPRCRGVELMCGIDTRNCNDNCIKKMFQSIKIVTVDRYMLGCIVDGLSRCVALAHQLSRPPPLRGRGHLVLLMYS